LGIVVDRGLAVAARFIYRAELPNGLVEHELDYVVTGVWAADPRPDASEVSEWRWMPRAELELALATDPSRYTAWLSPVLDSVRLVGGRAAADPAAVGAGERTR